MAGSSPARQPWTGSPQGDWIIAAVVALWCAVLLYSAYVAFTAGGDDLLTRFVGPIDDPSWMPPGQDLVRLAGRHYFGDWQIFVGWGRDPNPYILWPLVLNSLPGAYFFLAAVGVLPFSYSIWLFFGMTIGLTALGSFALLREFNPSQRLILTVVLFGSSIGMLFTLGRGALQGVAMAMIGIALALAYREVGLFQSRPEPSDVCEGRWGSRRGTVLQAMAISFAVMLKPYFAVLLLWPLLARHWRVVWLTLSIVGVTSLVGFAVLPGGLVTSLQGLFRGLSPYSSGDMTYHMGGAVSLVGFLLSVVRITAGPNQVQAMLESASPLAMWAPAGLWLVVLVAIYFLQTLPKWMFVVLLLASTQLILPTAQVYTMVWAPWALIVILISLAARQQMPGVATGKPPVRGLVENTCTFAVVTAVILSLVQIPRNVTGAMGWPVPMTTLLSPGLLVLAAGCCLLGSLYLRLRASGTSAAFTQ